MNLPEKPTETLLRLNPHLFGIPSKPAIAEEAMREADLHEQIREYCVGRGWIVLTGSMATRTARTCGESDFSIRADNGRVFDVECKRPGGKLSPAQLAMSAHFTKLGHIYHVVHSLDEFKAIVES